MKDDLVDLIETCKEFKQTSIQIIRESDRNTPEGELIVQRNYAAQAVFDFVIKRLNSIVTKGE